MDQTTLYVAVPQKKYIFAQAMSYREKYDYNQYETCPRCGRRLSGGKWIGEKSITVGKKKLPDFLYIAGGADLPFLLSERAYNTLSRNGITGIVNAEKIHKVLRNGEELTEKFFDLSVLRCDCPVDDERSKIAYAAANPERKPCDLCTPAGRIADFVFSLSFKPEVTVSADIFTTYQTGGMLFLSERFVTVCDEYGLTGLNYQPIHRYDSASEIFSQDEITRLTTK